MTSTCPGCGSEGEKREGNYAGVRQCPEPPSVCRVIKFGVGEGDDEE